MTSVSTLIWYLVGQIEKQRNTPIHHVIITGSHLEFTLSRSDELSNFASESGSFTITNHEDDVYPKQLMLTYSDHDMCDELHVYVAEESDGQFAPTAILRLHQHDEPLCHLIHQIEDVVQNTASVFQQHNDSLKEQFLSYMDEMYDKYTPKTCTVRFVGHYQVEDDNIPLGRLDDGEVITITSHSVPLQLDDVYLAIHVNGEYFVRDYANIDDRG